jgi:hypothetical protein
VSPELEGAIDAVYAAFAAPKPRVIEGCPCCSDKRNTDILLSKPLRELTGEDLWPYVSGVFLTIGDMRDYRYLLPRIFEIAIVDPGSCPNIEIVLGKLKLATWRSWSAGERTSIETLLDAWFDAVLAQAEQTAQAVAEGDVEASYTFEASRHLDELICGFSQAGMDLTPFLDRLRAPRYAGVVEDWRALNTCGKTGLLKLSNPFWSDLAQVWSENPQAPGPVLDFLETTSAR